ncbi:MAG: ornithine cyclodeaminase family protein [bacterium]
MTLPDVAVRFLSRQDVIACGALDMHAAVADVEAALRLQNAGETIMPPEAVLRWRAAADGQTGRADETGAYALPAYLGGSAPVAGVKWTAHRPPRGAEGGQDPTVMGLIVLTDPRSGRPFAVMESALVGAVRTAATTGVALRLLRRTDAAAATLIGAGLQAEMHLRMLAAVLPRTRRVILANRTRDRAERLVRALAGLPWTPELSDLGPAAVENSDVVIACTAAASPFVDAGWVHPGMAAVSVGPYEFSYDAVRVFDAVVVDAWGDFKRTSLKGLFRMYRDGQFDESSVAADLGELVAGTRDVPRESSIFVSVFGMSIFDVAVAARIARVAEERGAGHMFPLFQ